VNSPARDGREAAVSHAAVAAAWAEVTGDASPVVESLRLRKKSAVYRLWLDDGYMSVIGKRARADVLQNEYTIYREVLSVLPLPSIRAHGLVHRPDGWAWLFLEDAGDECCDPRATPERTAAWLGTLHGAAAVAGTSDVLPERGSAHYREHLRRAHERLVATLQTSTNTGADKHSLCTLASLLEQIDGCWERVEQSCAGGPLTLVHGDFVKRNLRLLGDGSLVALDWEFGGKAPPAADLVLLADNPSLLPVYKTVVKRFLPDVSDCQVLELARLGRGLRLLAAMDWATVWLECPWPETGMAQMRTYEPALRSWGQSLE
jgi:Phosphotransferase enzyme family